MVAELSASARRRRLLRGQKKAPRLKIQEAFGCVGFAQRENNSRRATNLLLRRCRRLRRWCTLRRRGPRRGSRGLGRVALVEQANDVLRHVHRIRRKDYRRSLSGAIQNDGERIVAGILAQHVNHAAADAVHDLALRFVEIVLCVLRTALERALELFALALQTRLFRRRSTWSGRCAGGSEYLPSASACWKARSAGAQIAIAIPLRPASLPRCW